MDANEKRQLVKDLAAEFWPATLIYRMSDMMDDRSFLFFDIVRSMSDEDAEGDVIGEVRQRIIDKLSELSGVSATREFILWYSFDDGLGMDLFGPGNEKPLSGELIDAVLDVVPESHIREQFKKFQIGFFEFTDSSPEDWHMRPVPSTE